MAQSRLDVAPFFENDELNDENPQTKALLLPMDKILRCPICFNYFDTCMFIPLCGHHYCSICIRRSLSFKTQCPSCRVNCDSIDLKNNRLVDDITTAYLNMRLALAAWTKEISSKQQPLPTPDDMEAFQVPNITSGKNAANTKIDNQVVIVEDQPDRKRKLSVTNNSPIKKTKIAAKPNNNEGKSQMHISSDTWTRNGKVECPVCSIMINAHNINEHLDTCLGKEEGREQFFAKNSKTLPKESKKPPPKYCYNLFTDKKLRELLKQNNLNTKGDRQTLIKRHKEFVIRYSAECDRENPKSELAVAKEVTKIEEKANSLPASPTEIKVTDNEFSALIEQIKKRTQVAKKLMLKANLSRTMDTTLSSNTEMEVTVEKTSQEDTTTTLGTTINTTTDPTMDTIINTTIDTTLDTTVDAAVDTTIDNIVDPTTQASTALAMTPIESPKRSYGSPDAFSQSILSDSQSSPNKGNEENSDSWLAVSPTL